MGLNQLLRKIATGSTESPSLCLVKNDTNQVVNITATLNNISVEHKGKSVVIRREKNTDAVIPALFNKTSRPCPPFCVQPMIVAPNVETIGELELLDYLQQSNDGSVVIVDSRIKNWVDKGTIPGSINIPWTFLANKDHNAIKQKVKLICTHFLVKLADDATLDFSNAKTIVLYCNGPWCGQTSESIEALLEIGYPAKKIKYYREGMQGWVSLGLTITTD